jgi:hypothetical protein
MRKNNLLLCTIIIAALSLFSSCKKDNNVTLTIKLTPAQASFVTGAPVTISGTATTTGALREIKFYTVSATGATEVEIPGSAITTVANQTTADFSAVLTNLTATKITVKAIDQNGQTVATVFTLTITAAPSNINTYSSLQLGGWDSNYGSCLDVDAGTPYGSSAMADPTLNSKIDVFFDEAKLGNVDLDSVYYSNVSRLHDTGIRYATTTLSSIDFDKVTYDTSFKDLTATLKVVPIKVNDVVFFIAKSGKKGLLRVNSLSSPTGDIMLDEKIQK